MAIKQQKNKTHILFRYGLITILFLGFSSWIAYNLFQTTVVNRTAWNQKAKEDLSQEYEIIPDRGDILSDNGSILACNVVVYDIAIDLRHPKLKDRVPTQLELDSLADSLDVHYPRYGYKEAKSEAERERLSWHSKLSDQMEKPFNKRSRALFLCKGGQEYDLKQIRQFPFFKRFVKMTGSRNPIYVNLRNKRIYPFGTTASLSIGRVSMTSESSEIHGYSGIERDLDSLLYGKKGLSKSVTTTNGVARQVVNAAQPGHTILTTINIDMQDMLEEQLLTVCQEHNAKWGTAILMEVETGEIKAISNVEWLDSLGIYGESLNRAVLPFEPGSVMKPISLMIALEDGLVKSINETVDCSPFQRTNDPHAPTVKTMKQVIEMSSNTGISRVIFRGYKDHPEKFYDRLASIGFFEPMRTGIAEEKRPQFRRLTDKTPSGLNITMTARHLDLARQSFGYVSMIPPMYTLSIYNAFANGGKYIRPHLVRGLRDKNGRDTIFPKDYIREQVCSEATASKIRECLHEVVWGKHGTARLVQDDRVEIAGKTGTAFPVEHGQYNRAKRRYAFCGFFPYDKPKYSCMVLMEASGGTSANRTSGQVLKNVALKMYAHGMLSDPPSLKDGQGEGRPVSAVSQKKDAKAVASELNIKRHATLQKPREYAKGTVPDVTGYDAPTALALLEKQGLNVRLQGQGRVSRQSVPPGSELKKGQTITLTLKS